MRSPFGCVVLPLRRSRSVGSCVSETLTVRSNVGHLSPITFSLTPVRGPFRYFQKPRISRHYRRSNFLPTMMTFSIAASLLHYSENSDISLINCHACPVFRLTCLCRTARRNDHEKSKAADGLFYSRLYRRPRYLHRRLSPLGQRKSVASKRPSGTVDKHDSGNK